jgi:cell division protein FtsB
MMGKLRQMPIKNERDKPSTGKDAGRTRRLNWARLLLCCFLAYNLINIAGQEFQLWQLRQDLRAVEQSLTAARQQQEILHNEIERLHTDSYIEQLAREELGMIRQGEIPYAIGDVEIITESGKRSHSSISEVADAPIIRKNTH